MVLALLSGPAAAVAEVAEADDRTAPADPREVAREAAQDALARAVDELIDAEGTLRDRLAAVGGARRAGGAADGAVRRAEGSLPDAVAEVARTAAALAAAERAVVRLERRVEVLDADLVEARDVLADRAVRTFKAGQLSQLTGPVGLVREARDPGELAHHLGHLRGVTRDGARTVTVVTDELAAARADLAAAREAVELARTEVAAAETDLVETEATAAARRSAAARAEASVVAAMEAEVAARARVARAADALDRAIEAAARHEVDGAARGRAEQRAEAAVEALATDDEDPREEQVAGRRRAHQRQTALAAERRRTADDWRCPVADARFANDWAFPRSGDRRHEGTDVFAARGTPVRAVVDGTVTAVERVDRSGSLGGRHVSVTAGDHRHYYAHLDEVADVHVGERVRAGRMLGTVGTTGNARGTPPHLHLGWYVDDVAVNPYASLAVACR